MSEIRILPEQVANQIAAGEVVERPASVVKELMENAFDAGAHNIRIEVEGGGSRLIRVIDDGRGMDADDMLLCLERHATSKIRTAQDLDAITTLGFRGEAMPSIASVSDTVITSRKKGAQLGNRVEVRFGKIVKIHEMGASQGTVVEVRRLFGNVPARRKFLKSVRTELAHIEEAVLGFALFNPQMGFSYAAEGKSIFRLAPDSDSIASRMGFLAVGNPAVSLVAIGDNRAAGMDTGGIRVRGYLFPPDGVSWPGNKLRLFINGRMVKDRLLSQAIFEGAEGFFMKGRRPSGLVIVEVSPSMVDVNVHPTKQEVRFRKPAQVFQAVSGAVRAGIAGFQQEVSRRLFGSGKAPPDIGVERGARFAPAAVGAAARGTIATGEPLSLFAKTALPGSTQRIDPEIRRESGPNPSASGENLAGEEPVTFPAEKADNRLNPEGVRLIGQLHSSYLLLEDTQKTACQRQLGAPDPALPGCG
ncbi:MAG: DNA mismatch repair endonuclease MutL [Deltaproteobacteria bacterium]